MLSINIRNRDDDIAATTVADISTSTSVGIPIYNKDRQEHHHEDSTALFVNAFGMDSAQYKLIEIPYGDNQIFKVDVAEGSSVNCDQVSFCAHNGGTHTECLGHIVPHGPSVLSYKLENTFLKTILINIIPRKITSLSKDEYSREFVGFQSTSFDNSQNNTKEITSTMDVNTVEYQQQHRQNDLVISKECIKLAIDNIIESIISQKRCSNIDKDDLIHNVQSIAVRTNTPYIFMNKKENEMIVESMYQEFNNNNPSQIISTTETTKTSYTQNHFTEMYQKPKGALNINYSKQNPPYFTATAMEYISHEFPSLVSFLVDLPSIDREDDSGWVRNHKIYFQFDRSPYASLGPINGKLLLSNIKAQTAEFWVNSRQNVCQKTGTCGKPQESQESQELQKSSIAQRLVTEFCWIPFSLPMGWYVSQLNISGFDADAAPSSPVLYRSIFESVA